MKKYNEVWNDIHQRFDDNLESNDNWLLKYSDLLKDKTVLDLGCGSGYNALFLSKLTNNLLCIDYSSVGLEKLNKLLPNVKTKLDDISNLEIEDDSFNVIVADLSLHYFNKVTTIEIMNKLKSILSVDGVLLARVNSINDLFYGADSTDKVEDNLYLHDGYLKRFFDENQIIEFFSVVGTVNCKEEEMLRYNKPKRVYEIIVKK